MNLKELKKLIKKYGEKAVFVEVVKIEKGEL